MNSRDRRAACRRVLRAKGEPAPNNVGEMWQNGQFVPANREARRKQMKETGQFKNLKVRYAQ